MLVLDKDHAAYAEHNVTVLKQEVRHNNLHLIASLLEHTAELA